MRTGEELVKAGYLRTSNQYRLVARSPPGKSARDALYERQMEQMRAMPLKPEMLAYWEKAHRDWVELLGEKECAGYYARVWARADDPSMESVLTLTTKEFEDFKRAGGRLA